MREVIGPIATPDVIHWAPGLPKTRSGKIMRRILRKIAAKYATCLHMCNVYILYCPRALTLLCCSALAPRACFGHCCDTARAECLGCLLQRQSRSACGVCWCLI